MRLLLLPLLACGLLTCGQTPDANPTLCQLAEAREKYARQTVTVEGYLLVSRHGSVLTDPSCGYGVGLTWYEDDAVRLKDVAAVASRFSREPLMVRVKASGQMQQDATPNMVGTRSWNLAPATAEVLSVHPLPEQDVERYLRWLEGPSPEPFRPSR
jgi:hypothetical protein